MQIGVIMESHFGRLVLRVLSIFLLVQLCQAAPGLAGTEREQSVDALPPSAVLANPFGTGEEDRRLLQNFIQSSLKDGQGGPDITTWEQEVFFLFGLYDYERNGLLDGLELMRLLSDYNSHHTAGAEVNEQVVVSMVDFLLQTQDLNQDGMLAPSELLSSPLPQPQDSINNNTPPQEQEVEERLAGGSEQRDEAHEELQLQPDSQQQIKAEEQELTEPIDQQHGQHIPEARAAEQEQQHNVPVHQGQPEI